MVHPGRIIALLCAVALLWLATRPYFGTVFDGRFYMVEALNALHPGRFAEDLYFKFGSQGKFSAFTQLYLPLLRAFGVGPTAMILTILGQLFWLFALLRLARSLMGGRIMWLSAAMVIGILNIYAGGFGYGEPYVTPRLFAEAFVMLALALLPSSRPWAFVLLGLSAAIHPLMTLPGVAVAFVYLALGRPLWWAVMAAGAGLAAALGLAGVEPISNLFRTIDPAWFAIINIRSDYCLLKNWPTEFFVHVLSTIAWAVAALAMAGREHRRFLIAVLLVGVGGLACTFLGGDLAHNVMVVEVQPWRSMWLLQLASRIYTPVVLMALVARTRFDGFRWGVLLTLGLVLVSSVVQLVRNPNSAGFTPISLALVVAGLAVIAANLLLEQKHGRIVLAFALAGLALIPVALLRWDARTPWIRYLESPEPVPKDLAALLPEKASVYWEGGLEMLWLRLQRPSYFSCDQGTGALFYRATAMAYKHRADSFWPLRVGDFTQLDTCATFDPRPKPERNRLGVAKLCLREPGLDYLVLTKPLDGMPAKVWNSPVYFQDVQSSAGKFFAPVAKRFYIYSCTSVRLTEKVRHATPIRRSA
jgi:hypothetical protein